MAVTTARHRRVAGQGEDDPGLPRARATRSRPASATSATCPSAPRASPAKYKKRAVGQARRRRRRRLRALYVVDADKKKKVAELKRKLKDADELLLATDEDREGEAIAWHLLEVLEPKVPVQPHGVPRDHPRGDPAGRRGRPASSTSDLVDAQETRRILDRLYGYEVSPVLWKKVMPRPVGRPRAVGRHPPGRRARARADRVPSAPLLGRRGRLRPGRRSTRGSSPSTARASPRAATSTPTARLKTADAGRTSTRPAPRRWPRRSRARPSPCARVEDKPVPALARGAVHDLDAAAGGQPQAALDQPAHDARRAGAVRERLHHLHAHRLDDAVGDGARRGPHAGRASSTARSTSATSRAATRRRSRTRRRRTRRSARPATSSARRARSPASSTATSSRSTT